MTPETRPPDDQPLTPYEGGPLGSGIDWADPNSPLAPYYLRTGTVFAVGVIGLAFFLFSLFPLWHTDFWAHLKYGEWVVANRTLPKTEPLNPFTDKSKEMFDAMWLTQVTYYELFRAGESLAGGDALRRFAGGVEVVRLAHNFVVTAALAVLLLAYKRVSGSIAWAVGGVVLVVFFLLTPLQVQRPQTFAFLCFALVLLGISRDTPSRRFVAWAPALLVVWANLHGSFPIGFALVGLALVGRVIDRGRETEWSVRAVARDAGVRRLVLAIGIGLAAVAVLNPYGPSLFRNVARFSDSPNLQTMAEWQPIQFVGGSGAGPFYLLLGLLLVVTQAVSPRPFSPTQLLFVIVFGVWGLFQQRMFSWWLPLVPWIVAPHWVAAARKWGLTFRPGTPNFVKTLAAAGLAFVAVGLSPAVTWPRTGGPRPVEQALHTGTPFDIAAALTGATPADPARAGELPALVRDWYGGKFTGRIFSSESVGEYLLWALPPDAPVLMYNHAQLFPPVHWNECLAVKAGRPGWWEILDRHRVNLVAVEADGHAALRDEIKDHPGWRVVVDESDTPGRPPLGRLFVAVRKPTPGGTP